MQSARVDDVSARYRSFALHETPGHSATYTAWAQGIADDPALCDLIATLPRRERQPNLVFAVARAVSSDLVDPRQVEARSDECARLRAVLVERWDEIAALTAQRHTQTNDAGRIAALLPVLHTIHRACGKPLALVELGASAGLLLHPQAFTVRYCDDKGHTLSEFGPAAPYGTLEVTVTDASTEVPRELPPIDWRVGVDLNPLDIARPEIAEWLRVLVWPGQLTRLARLEAALAAADDDPVLVIPRDITAPHLLDEVLGLIPTDVHPVVFHCAVQAYLEVDERTALSQNLLDRAATGALSWVSYEGVQVVPQVAAALSADDEARLAPGDFVVALDGRFAYRADGHASWIG